jgi:hypothetical protein
MICYGSDGFNFESLNSSSSQQAFMDFSLLGRIDGHEDPMLESYDKVTSFSNTVEHHGKAVLQLLWLWLIMSKTGAFTNSNFGRVGGRAHLQLHPTYVRVTLGTPTPRCV